VKEPKVEAIEKIVIVVKDADKTAEYFNDLFGMEFSHGWKIQGQRIKVRSEVIEETQLQFIQATDPESVVAKFIASNS